MTAYESVRRFAERHDVHPETVRRWIAAGRLPGAKKFGSGPNSHWRIPTNAGERLR